MFILESGVSSENQLNEPMKTTPAKNLQISSLPPLVNKDKPLPVIPTKRPATNMPLTNLEESPNLSQNLANSSNIPSTEQSSAGMTGAPRSANYLVDESSTKKELPSSFYTES